MRDNARSGHRRRVSRYPRSGPCPDCRSLNLRPPGCLGRDVASIQPAAALRSEVAPLVSPTACAAADTTIGKRCCKNESSCRASRASACSSCSDGQARWPAPTCAADSSSAVVDRPAESQQRSRDRRISQQYRRQNRQQHGQHPRLRPPPCPAPQHPPCATLNRASRPAAVHVPQLADGLMGGVRGLLVSR